MPRIGALILAAFGAGLGLLLAGSAMAATPPEEGQIVLFTPEKVWDETSWLSFIVRPGTKEPVLHARGRPFRVSWNMTSITGKTTTDALASVAEGDTLDAAAVLDRPLTASESRRFRVVPLYRDADVLVAATGHPACSSGLSLDQVRGILTGGITAWPAVVAAWPADRLPDIHAVVPSSPTLQGKRSMFGVVRPPLPRERVAPPGPRYAASVAMTSEASIPNFLRGEAVGAMGFQRARALLEAGAACAIPVDGVAPSVTTVRAGAYPASRTVGLAFFRGPVDPVRTAIRTRYLSIVTGPRGDRALARVFGPGVLPA